MDLWFLYAILSAIFAGLYSFLVKVGAEKNYDSSLFNAYSFSSYSFLAFISYIFLGSYMDNLLLLVVLSILAGITYLMTSIFRMESLKNIVAVLYFPIYKISSALIVTLVGIFIFKDTFSTSEAIGIILGLFVPIVLINKKDNHRQKNIVKGILLCLGAGLFVSLGAIIGKLININNIDIHLYLFISGTVSAVLSFIQYKRAKLNNKMTLKIKRISLLSGILLFFSATFFIRSLSGKLGAVYTISSFSILIPIILSLIFYKEKLDLRKIIAIILTIVSMLFFKVF